MRTAAGKQQQDAIDSRQAAALHPLMSPWCRGMVLVHFHSYHEFSAQVKPRDAHERRQGRRVISREDEKESDFESIFPRIKLSTNTNNGSNDV